MRTPFPGLTLASNCKKILFKKAMLLYSVMPLLRSNFLRYPSLVYLHTPHSNLFSQYFSENQGLPQNISPED